MLQVQKSQRSECRRSLNRQNQHLLALPDRHRHHLYSQFRLLRLLLNTHFRFHRRLCPQSLALRC